MNELNQKSFQDKREKVLETGLILVSGLMGVYLLKPNLYLLYTAFSLGVIFFLFPRIAFQIHRAWMGLGTGMGWIMSRLILGLLWFVIVTPIAAVYRMFGHDPLQLKNKSNSLFKTENKKFEPGDLENTW
jgi:hypothetical protein